MVVCKKINTVLLIKFVTSKHLIELVIFDCDGVLIDSEAISAAILIQELRAINIDIDFDYVLKNFLGRSFPEVTAEIGNWFGASLPADFEKHYRHKLLDEFKHNLNTTQGIEHVLNNLNVKTCVATSSSPARVARSLELVKLKNHFGNNVFTVSEVKKSKPAPDLFFHAARIMQVSPENCLVIEDSLYGVRAALSAGMDVMRYLGGSHYSGSVKNEETARSSVVAFDNWSTFFLNKPELKK